MRRDLRRSLAMVTAIAVLGLPSGRAAGASIQTTVVQVKDINPGPEDSFPGPFFDDLTAVDDTLFFRAADGLNGEELWKSDGTEAGTTLVKDINSSPFSSFPSDLAAVNDTLFFRADDGEHGIELWKSEPPYDADHTTLVKDIRPGELNGRPFDSVPLNLTNIGGTLFFSASDGLTGAELWESDGTEAGTVLVKDINPGPDGSFPRGFTDFDGTVLFSADGGLLSGRELWKSDGTLLGTTLVRDIRPGPSDSFPGQLTNVDGTVLFTADDGLSGRELWKSDGTLLGTVQVEDINPSGHSHPRDLTNVDGTLFFTAEDSDDFLRFDRELWKSETPYDAEHTIRVKDIRPGPNGSFGIGASAFSVLADVGKTLFFRADDGEHGSELWKSDGTEAGTVLVKDINPGSDDFPPDPDGSFPGGFTDFGGTLFFTANDGEHGNELWKSDGTADGTVLINDIRPGRDSWGAFSSFARFLTVVKGRLFLTADDGLSGRELWRTHENQPPDCAGVTASPEVIETAVRDQFQSITLSGASDPDGDAISFRIDGVSQDEPVSGEGIGDDTSPDAQFTAAGAGSNEVIVRTERNPMGNGRVYRIAYTVSDVYGAACSGTAGVGGDTNARVSVPRKKGDTAVDGGDTHSWNSFTGEQTL